MQDEILDNGQSSGASSPSSDAIDMDDNFNGSELEADLRAERAPRQQGESLLQSPMSPRDTQRNTEAGRHGSSKTAGGQRGPAGPTKRAGRHAAGPSASGYRDGARDHHESGKHQFAPGGGMLDPGQGSAYDKLLDLKYPRGYGDVAMRYDAALAASSAGLPAQGSTNSGTHANGINGASGSSK